jgi:glutamine synthetase
MGTYLSGILEDIVSKVTDRKMTPALKTELKLGIGKIPEILLDNTDRNRTSPFAFTGNRFEFRAVGASANCSAAMIALNSAVARQLSIFGEEVDAVIKKGRKKDEAIFQVLKKYIIDSKRIRFDGDGYSEEWIAEAKKRGLHNIESVPVTLTNYLKPEAKQTLIGTGVFSEKELESRVEVEFEKFIKKVQIQARVLGDLAINHIVPIATNYMTSLLNNIKALKEVFDNSEFERLASARKEVVVNISDHISAIKILVHDMIEARRKANKITGLFDRAVAYEKKVKPYLDEIRDHIDRLELIVDNEMWPLPKYREILFTR